MIKIITVGKFKDTNTQNIHADYIKRVNKFHKLEVVELKEYTLKSDIENLEIEAVEIEKNLVEKSFIIALTPGGKELDSIGLSTLIENKLSTDANLTFIIGSSNGLSERIINKSHYLLSFSKMTFPHLLFRIMLLEQIYRAFKILNNERYHK